MFQGVQSPWPRPKVSSRSPASSAMRAAACRCSPAAEESIRASVRDHQGDAASRARSTAAPRASSRVGAGGGSGETCGRPPVAGATAVTALPFQSPLCRSSGTANAAAGDPASARSASASAMTSPRVRSFQPTLAKAATRPPGADTWTTGFPFGRAAPTRTARSTRRRSRTRARWWESTRSGRSPSPTPGATATDARPRRRRCATPARRAAATAAAARRSRAGAPLENCVTAAAAGPGAEAGARICGRRAVGRIT